MSNKTTQHFKNHLVASVVRAIPSRWKPHAEWLVFHSIGQPSPCYGGDGGASGLTLNGRQHRVNFIFRGCRSISLFKRRSQAIERAGTLSHSRYGMSRQETKSRGAERAISKALVDLGMEITQVARGVHCAANCNVPRRGYVFFCGVVIGCAKPLDVRTIRNAALCGSKPAKYTK